MLLLRRVQRLGIQTIAGDIVLDRSAFEVPPTDPSSFDGEPLRPYNAAPDALLINFKSVVMTLTPEASSNLARVQHDPRLAEADWVAGFCNVAMTWWLSACLGGQGAAIATCIEQSLVCGILWPLLAARGAEMRFTQVWGGLFAWPVLRAALK